ncbi:MAG: FxsA protein [Helicobacteraceae bacterium CG2_30_36_10]|nr:MAG: FxsA protein [Helicobacteraceae bacterium CG2_30_36_10]
MIYFFVYLFLEVLLSVNLSSYIGGLMTFFEIVISAFIGITILVNFRKTLAQNMNAVSYNCIDLKQFQGLNLFTIFGAILLILPGFLTDIIGLLMQFSIFTTMLVNRYHVKSGSCNTSHETNNIKKDLDVIDVEIISDNTITK